MTTNVHTLQEFADILGEIADEWDDPQPIVLVGDVHGNLNVNKKDGYTQHGTVGYANEIFESNGVFTLGQNVNREFYGTMLVERENLADSALDQMDICRRCYHEIDDCSCPEAQEVEA